MSAPDRLPSSAVDEIQPATKLTINQVLFSAAACGIAHNGGAGGEYLLVTSEKQLLSWVESMGRRWKS